MANPEILLGEIEAKTRELIGTQLQTALNYDDVQDFDLRPKANLTTSILAARRTTPLLEYIKTKKIEKQVEIKVALKYKMSAKFCETRSISLMYHSLISTENKGGEARREKKKGI